jgi:16S rRNA (guanine527-N7)-methyltransferase
VTRGHPGPPGAGSPHRPALEALGLAPTALGPLAAYLDLLAAWNARVNLTGARTPLERVRVLVEPALNLAPYLVVGSVLDIGSGNGSPGLILAVLQPHRPVTLLEPRLRRWAFLKEAVRVVGRPGTRVLRICHREYHGPAARNVLVRGLLLAPATLAPLLESSGQLLMSGPPRPCGEALAWQGCVGAAPLRFQRYCRSGVPRETLR